jgi:hypothetical protein
MLAAQEVVFLNSPIVVTSARIVMGGGHTLATAHVASVTRTTIPAQVGTAILAILIGVGLIIGGAVALKENPGVGAAFLVLAAILIGAGVIACMVMKAKHVVYLDTSGGRMTAYLSIHPYEADMVANAVTRAITTRG